MQREGVQKSRDPKRVGWRVYWVMLYMWHSCRSLQWMAVNGHIVSAALIWKIEPPGPGRRAKEQAVGVASVDRWTLRNWSNMTVNYPDIGNYQFI